MGHAYFTDTNSVLTGTTQVNLPPIVGYKRLIFNNTSQTLNVGSVNGTIAIAPGTRATIQCFYQPVSPGTVQTFHLNPAVAGTLTTFTTSLAIGTMITFSNQPNSIYTIASITSNTVLGLSGY